MKKAKRTLRQAMLLAADFIEKHPKQYSFMECHVPADRKCGTPGCILGWTGYFLGLPAGTSIWGGAREAFGASVFPQGSYTFVLRLEKIAPDLVEAAIGPEKPKAAAKLLRLYVKHYLTKRARV